MKKWFFLFSSLATISCLLGSIGSFSQNVLPPKQPEQDACNALHLCGTSFSTPYSYQGLGQFLDITTTPCGGGETNSMWIKMTIATAGSFVFSIIPKDPVDDYDFAVFKSGCSNLSQTNVVRCNFNNNFVGSNVNGIVGLSLTGTENNVLAGSTGNSFCKAIDAQPGETYLIMISNFGNDNSGGGGVSAGFTIDFSGSTATFAQDPPPAMDKYIRQCSDTSVSIELTTPVLCSSIAADGSDFYCTPAIPISSATGVNCINGDGYTRQVTIGFSGHAPAGNYVLHARVGSNGTTLLDFCNNPMLVPATLPFSIPPMAASDFLPPDTVKCFYSTLSLTSKNEFVSYVWSTGQTTPGIQVVDPGVYTLMATDTNGCVGIDSINIKDSTCPQYIYLPSAFTPNADGKNDFFRPKFAGATTYYRFIIYNRWGRKVFESGDPSQGWDGTIDGKPQPTGTYVWVCTYTLFRRPEEMQKGTVMLVR
ncbi:MAG TPA: gliding motility-associated C-terminal domain-containing protein [Puia sp.]|nr:gliding motility-associated C-terminal domain-containing protein [Puia sp.]